MAGGDFCEKAGQHSEIVRLLSALDARNGNALDEIFLGKEEKHDYRNGENQRRGHHRSPFYKMDAHKSLKPQRKGVLRLLIQVKQRPHKV